MTSLTNKKPKRQKLVIVEEDKVDIGKDISKDCDTTSNSNSTDKKTAVVKRGRKKKANVNSEIIEIADKVEGSTNTTTNEMTKPSTITKKVKNTNKTANKNTVLEDQELFYSIHLTNVHSNCTISQIYENIDILRFGEIIQIVICTKLPSPDEDEDNRQSEAYIYFKGSTFLINKHPLLERILNNTTDKKVNLVHFLEGDAWLSEKNTITCHFRMDEYEQKRIIIQCIGTCKNSLDINWLFREHGEVEQVDMVWIKSEQFPNPTHCQCYVYFREWGDELFTYKLLEELNEVGVFTVKYDYNGYNDLLWIYELSPRDELKNIYDFEYGKYIKWFPEDDPKYGSRYDKKNKLNWYFTNEGRFAYAEKIVEEELMKHGGLFIGPEKTFYKVEILRKPLEFSWKTTDDVDENMELQKAQQFLMDVFQKFIIANVNANSNSNSSYSSTSNTNTNSAEND